MSALDNEHISFPYFQNVADNPDYVNKSSVFDCFHPQHNWEVKWKEFRGDRIFSMSSTF